MSRLKRPLLLALLCLLVISWGTCPCAVAQAFAGNEETGFASEDVGCPCCRHRAPPIADEPQVGDRQKGDRQDDAPTCPSGGRSGPNRDLPPSSADDLETPPAPEAGNDACPALTAAVPPLTVPQLAPAAASDLEATGPPSALSPHGCPVGIVRLLN